MELEVTKLDDEVTCARLQGRLDSPGADRVGIRFTAGVVAPGKNAIVDLSGVSFVASMGIRLLISSARALNGKGVKMVLFGATELVQNVFDQCALDQIIPIVATQQHALEQLVAQ
jgi:anti-sigma B factor antagonist